MSAAENLPLVAFSLDEIENWFVGFEGARHIALAVSGGGDSVALMVLMARWLAAKKNIKITVLTVDHGLRAEAAGEALETAGWARDMGFEHCVLTWKGAKPKTGIQAKAREIRYRLMLDWCNAHNVRHLGLAHNLDDQAETVLMRLARGSSVDGLAAMAPISERSGIALIRPLLEVSRENLRSFLRECGQVWIDDPSNEDDGFERVRIRKLLAALEGQGFERQNLALSAARFARARAALDDMAQKAAQTCLHLFDAGFVIIDRDKLLSFPIEIILRLLKACLMGIGSEATPPRLEKLENLTESLLAQKQAAYTLAGCSLVELGEKIVIFREVGRKGLSELTLEPASRQIWDGRFDITLSKTCNQALSICALGEHGWQLLKSLDHPITPLPAYLAQILPSFWHGDALMAVPHLGYFAENLPKRALKVELCAIPFLGACKPLALNEAWMSIISTKNR